MYYTIGGFTLDDTVLPDGEVRWAAPGGNVLYSAIGARLWDVPVGMISPVGFDYPQEYLDRLEEAGFDLSGVRRIDYPSFHVWILHEGEGRRQIIYRLDSGSNIFLDPTVEDIPSSCLESNAVHICPIRGDSQNKLAEHLIAHNVPLFLDLIVIPGQIDVKLLTEMGMWKNLTAFLPSIEEVFAVFGEFPLSELLKKVEIAAPPCFSIKMGHHGSLLRNPENGRYYHIPVFPTQVVDATGAGDSYCGGFIVGLQETQDPIEAALRATVSASFLIEDFGALHALQVTHEMAHKRLEFLRPRVRMLDEDGIQSLGSKIQTTKGK